MTKASKATERRHAKAWRSKLIVEQHPKGCRVTYNFDLCKACIILKENQEFSDNSEQNSYPVPPRRKPVFGEKRGAGERAKFSRKRKRSQADFATSRSSWKERKGNALASGAEEGRDKLRKASGRSKYPLIRGYPNGATRLDNIQSSCVEQNRRRKGTA